MASVRPSYARGAQAHMPPVSERLDCIVEVRKGSRNKYAWDPELRRIRLDRFLFASVVYPADFGYFPRTLRMVTLSMPSSACRTRRFPAAGSRSALSRCCGRVTRWGSMTRSSAFPSEIRTGARSGCSRTCPSSCAARSRTLLDLQAARGVARRDRGLAAAGAGARGAQRCGSSLIAIRRWAPMLADVGSAQ